jgi:hypothetical protein
MVMGRSTKRDM